MGVPGFNSWFARNHRHAYVSYVNKSWDHVYIDMASILHAAMKKGKFALGFVAHFRLFLTQLCACSIQPPTFSQNPLYQARWYHGHCISSQERHVCLGWASALSKAPYTKVSVPKATALPFFMLHVLLSVLSLWPAHWCSSSVHVLQLDVLQCLCGALQEDAHQYNACRLQCCNAAVVRCRKRRARESASSTNSTSESAAPYVTLVQPWSTSSSSTLANAPVGILQQPRQADSSAGSDIAKSGTAGGALLALPKKQGLSTMGLTPGTPLMAEIERSLEFYICQRLQKWKHLEFELSGARVQVRLCSLHNTLVPKEAYDRAGNIKGKVVGEGRGGAGGDGHLALQQDSSNPLSLRCT